ncbi:maleate cis-trans isomerase family protein [Oceanibaculum pacificum]|uniref:maleate cis-trans isomerase family protein n=1 Tax=Oceanibaculum pacificum TaxID=580166 RepID=UPI000ABD08CB|nr:aspartate/glutamate racemase family protein [Oceanibaculum pacificum]
MNDATLHSDAANVQGSGADLINLEHLPFQTDGGIGSRAAVGLLVLETDQTIEDEFRAIWPRDGVALYAARLHNDVIITPEKLLQMQAEIPPAAKLLPFMTDFKAIAFACTSGALVIGEDKVAALIHSVKPGVKVTDPVTAARAAISSMGVKRVALLTPYVKEINERLRDSLVARGLDIPVMGSFNEADDDVVARITPDAIRDAIVEIGSRPECDGVFVSCTSLRVAKIAEEAEALIGKPVTSSNHALAWHMLRLAGIEDEIPGFGRLFRTQLKA